MEVGVLWLYEQPLPKTQVPFWKTKQGKMAFSAAVRGTDAALLLLLFLFLLWAFVDEVAVAGAAVADGPAGFAAVAARLAAAGTAEALAEEVARPG